ARSPAAWAMRSVWAIVTSAESSWCSRINCSRDRCTSRYRATMTRLSSREPALLLASSSGSTLDGSFNIKVTVYTQSSNRSQAGTQEYTAARSSGGSRVQRRLRRAGPDRYADRNLRHKHIAPAELGLDQTLRGRPAER